MTGIERLVDIVNDGPYSGGMIHISVQKLREICEQIEREVADISGYESDVLAFVEEKGGLDVIKERLRETMPRAAYDRINRRKNRRIRELEKELEDMRGRLMPDGIEWPRFEDDEMVGFGDEYVNAKGNVSTLRTIVIKDCRDRLGGGYYWKLGKGACAVMVKNGERIKRPPVLAADGKPLEKGQTVYVIENGKTHHVTEVDVVSKRFRSMEQIDGSHWLDPMCFTHQRPVLDADGVPIHEGDTVYLLPGEWCGEYPLRYYSAGDEMVVKEMYSDCAFEGVLKCAGDGKCDCFPMPCQLTHTKPEPLDSAERIAEDIGRMAEEWCSYPTLWEASEKAASSVGKATMGAALRSLSKRCRALDERERSE